MSVVNYFVSGSSISGLTSYSCKKLTSNKCNREMVTIASLNKYLTQHGLCVQSSQYIRRFRDHSQTNRNSTSRYTLIPVNVVLCTVID